MIRRRAPPPGRKLDGADKGAGARLAKGVQVVRRGSFTSMALARLPKAGLDRVTGRRSHGKASPHIPGARSSWTGLGACRNRSGTSESLIHRKARPAPPPSQQHGRVLAPAAETGPTPRRQSCQQGSCPTPGATWPAPRELVLPGVGVRGVGGRREISEAARAAGDRRGAPAGGGAGAAGPVDRHDAAPLRPVRKGFGQAALAARAQGGAAPEGRTRGRAADDK